MKNLILIVCCALLASRLKGQSTQYDASLINKDLLQYASAVIRNQETVTEVKGPDDVITTVKQAITVLNKNGDEMAHIVIEHDKANIIKYVKGAVFNASGKQVFRFSERQF